MKISFKVLAGLLIAGLSAAAARGAIVTVNGGTGSPPATLGGYTMTAFGTDTGTSLGSSTTSVASPLGGSLGFSAALTHVVVGGGWATWSNGYTGDVYYSTTSNTNVLSLPANTGAFNLYIEPNGGNFTMTATAQDGSTLSEVVNSSGGAGAFGFYSTSNSPLTSITVISGDPSGFAVGEFSIATASVPEPTALGVLAIAGLGMLRRKRRD